MSQQALTKTLNSPKFLTNTCFLVLIYFILNKHSLVIKDEVYEYEMKFSKINILLTNKP